MSFAYDWNQDRPPRPPQTVPPFDPEKVSAPVMGAHEVRQNAGLIQFMKGAGIPINPATVPWCAAYVNAVLSKSGHVGTDSLAARSFLKWGDAVNQPQVGDVVVLSRGDPHGSKGHVGFYAGPGDTPGTVKLLGGNQGDTVSKRDFPVERVLGYRRISPTTVANSAPPPDAKAVRTAYATEGTQQDGPAQQQIRNAVKLDTPTPKPAAVTAPTVAAGPEQRGTVPDILAPVGQPGDPRRAALYGPNAQSTAAARPGGLGGMLASLFGGGGAQVAPGRSSYVDPNTGHRILNPGGSGEEAMGLTRDIGPARTPTSSTGTTRSAPAPQRPAAAQPPGAPTAPAAPAAPASLQRGTVPDILAPQPGTGIDARRITPFDNLTPPDERGFQPPGDQVAARPAQADFLSAMFPATHPTLSPFRTAATPPPPAVSPLTGAPNANALALAPTMFDVKPTEQQRPLGDFKPALSPFDTARVEMPFDEFALQRQRAIAPPQAASLAAQRPEPPTPAWSPPPSAPAAFPVGGVKTPELPYMQPRTVDQQLGGLSPFEQWPPPWWDVGGGGFGGGFGGGGGYDFGAFG